MEKFGLQVGKKRLSEFSKGMRQKLALIRALLHEPPVILLDEPTSAMDPESAFMVREAIRELRSSDRTIVLCTHNLKEAEELADQIAIIKTGKIILNGALDQVRRKLLGPHEYILRVSGSLDGHISDFPENTQLIERSSDHIKYSTEDPEQFNPWIIKSLSDLDVKIVTLQEVTRSLEDIYLQIINQEMAG
jgi:ABC-2 type transport system ATP-binding protein